MTKKMTAAVRNNETGNTSIITSEYETRKAFRDDLNANGYQVIGAVTVEGEYTKRDELRDRGIRGREANTAIEYEKETGRQW